MSSIFVRFQEILNQAFAENFICLNWWIPSFIYLRTSHLVSPFYKNIKNHLFKKNWIEIFDILVHFFVNEKNTSSLVLMRFLTRFFKASTATSGLSLIHKLEVNWYPCFDPSLIRDLTVSKASRTEAEIFWLYFWQVME